MIYLMIIIGGVDYTLSSRPITFTDTTDIVSCENRLTISSDMLVEITESFTLSFTYRIGSVERGDEVEVVIYDADGMFILIS